MSEVTFPTDIPNGTPVSGDRILFSKTSESGAAYDTDVMALPISTAAQTSLDAKESTANKGQPNGYAPLDATGKIPVANLPPGMGTGQVNSVVGWTSISVDSTDPANPVVSLYLGADENFVTDAEKTVLSNTSNTNTGDQTAFTVSFDPTGTTLSATEVQSALVELAAEKIQEPTNAYATGYVLTWNGTDWVGQENTPAVGSASKFYLDATATLADNLALSISPSTFPETTISVSADADIGWGVSFIERFVSWPLGRTSIPAGNWDFSTFGSVSAVTGTNFLHTRINRRSELTGMTATFTGTGTTRTLTVTGGTPFVAGDANASVLAATLVETPNQTCWISGFTSSSEVTVTVTDAGYVNEVGTPLSALYYRLFLASTSDIATTGIQEFSYSTTQPEFTGLNPTDRIVAAYFCQTDSGTARTFTLYYGGTERFSSFESPIKTAHSDLMGLAWASSGHTGTANKLAGFGPSGEAVYVDVPTGGSSLWTTVTGTRTGNTTFTVTGDVTSTFARGLVIKWTESSSQKCGYVVSSSYSAPDTTVTIIGDAMTSIDASSLKWTATPLEKIKGVIAWDIGAIETDVGNVFYAHQEYRILSCDIDSGTAGVTGSTTVDVNKNGTTMFTTKPTLATTVATSPTPFAADSGSALAIGDRVSFDVDGFQTTPATDLYITVYAFPELILNLA